MNLQDELCSRMYWSYKLVVFQLDYIWFIFFNIRFNCANDCSDALVISLAQQCFLFLKKQEEVGEENEIHKQRAGSP